MANWNDVFSNEVCKCGKKGEFLITNGSGKVVGFACDEHKTKNEE